MHLQICSFSLSYEKNRKYFSDTLMVHSSKQPTLLHNKSATFSALCKWVVGARGVAWVIFAPAIPFEERTTHEENPRIFVASTAHEAHSILCLLTAIFMAS